MPPTLRYHILPGNYVDLAKLIHPSRYPHPPRELQSTAGSFEFKQPAPTRSKTLTPAEFAFVFSQYHNITFPNPSAELCWTTTSTTDPGPGPPVWRQRFLHISHSFRISSLQSLTTIKPGNLLGHTRTRAVLPCICSTSCPKL